MNRQRMKFFQHSKWLILSVIVIGCAPLTPPSASSPVPSVVAFPAATSAAFPSISTRAPSRETPITSTSAITLTLWTTEDLAPSDTPSGKITRNQFDAFAAANPNIHLQVILKKPYGKGGLLDSLLTTHAVVPAFAPDLIALDASEIPLAAKEEILQPLDGLMPPEAQRDLFLFAARATSYKNRWVAVPLFADTQHLVYNKTAVLEPPRTWDDLFKLKAPLLLPLGGDDAFLRQYASVGASWGDPSTSTLDIGATTQVLNFVKRVRDLGIVPESALGTTTADEAWSAFAAGQVAMAQVSASRYLAERDNLRSTLNASYAFIPTRDGRLASIASGWTVALITPDPARQIAAVRLIQWLINSEQLVPWLRAAHRIPANRATFSLAVSPPEYAAFLRDHFERASFLPPSAWTTKQSDAVRAAMASVWKGQATPEDAARAAAAASK